MATMTQTPKQRKRKQPEPVHGTARWVGGMATQGQLDNADAILQITAAGKDTGFYHVCTIRDNDGMPLGYKLTKIDGLEETVTYDLEITPHGLRCDCPDATYTDRPDAALGCGCKHAKGLKAALAAANLN